MEYDIQKLEIKIINDQLNSLRGELAKYQARCYCQETIIKELKSEIRNMKKGRAKNKK